MKSSKLFDKHNFKHTEIIGKHVFSGLNNLLFDYQLLTWKTLQIYLIVKSSESNQLTSLELLGVERLDEEPDLEGGRGPFSVRSPPSVRTLGDPRSSYNHGILRL